MCPPYYAASIVQTTGITALPIVFPQTPPASPEEASCQSFGLRQLQCQFVTLAKQYQDFDFSYAGQGQQEETDPTGQVSSMLCQTLQRFCVAGRGVLGRKANASVSF